MASQIDYRHPSSFPAGTVYATLVDRAFIEARLREIGGDRAEIVSHTADTGGARFTVRHQLDTAGLPLAVRSFVAGELVIERTEKWTVGPDGSYGGTVDVAIIGSPVPASAAGELGVAAVGEGSEFRLRVTASVALPLFGPSIEEFIGGQIRQLLDAETAFAARWLEKQRS